MKKRTSNFRNKLSSIFKAAKTFQLYPTKTNYMSEISTTEELIRSSWDKTGQALKDATYREFKKIEPDCFGYVKKKLESDAEPFPNLDILVDYAAIKKDLPDRIFSEFEKSLKSAREQEAKKLESQIVEKQRGQLMAFSIFVLLMLAVFYSLYVEEYGVACTLGVVYAELLALSFLF